MPDYITTYTGIRFYPAQPDAEGICIEDIAHALSFLCRGNGHVSKFWSVAEHCIFCAREAAAREWPARLVLACLLHDASECYLSDVPRPFKKELPGYRVHEGRLLSRKSTMELFSMTSRNCSITSRVRKIRNSMSFLTMSTGLSLKWNRNTCSSSITTTRR